MIEDKILADLSQLKQWLDRAARPLVMTNGCFDILHRGHVDYLEQAAGLGQSLVVAINDDASVKGLDKPGDRPINPLADRMAVLAALASVDAVIAFSQSTPQQLISIVKPDHLVKGGDWPVDTIVGATEVIAAGGQVHAIPFRYQRSTTQTLEKIKNLSPA
jgi:rfaE bifunctional protein nucleotidyltransferase chain/domain